MRKSRREKEKEAAEAKKKEEEENAAKAYAEFLDAFEAEDVGRRKAGSAFVRASGDSRAKELYQPSFKSPSDAAPKTANAFREEIDDVCGIIILQILLHDVPSPRHPLLHLSPKESVPWMLSSRKLRGALGPFQYLSLTIRTNRDQAMREARYARSGERHIVQDYFSLILKFSSWAFGYCFSGSADHCLSCSVTDDLGSI